MQCQMLLPPHWLINLFCYKAGVSTFFTVISITNCFIRLASAAAMALKLDPLTRKTHTHKITFSALYTLRMREHWVWLITVEFSAKNKKAIRDNDKRLTCVPPVNENK